MAVFRHERTDKEENEMRSWIKRVVLLCALVVGASAFAGCGDDDDGVTPDGSVTTPDSSVAVDARARD